MKALIVESDPLVKDIMQNFLLSRRYEVSFAETASDGLLQAKKIQPDIVFLANELPDAVGIDLLQSFHINSDSLTLFLTTSAIPLKQAVHAMKHGAEYVLQKPVELDHLNDLLNRFENDFYHRSPVAKGVQKDGSVACYQLIGTSPLIVKLQRLIELLAHNISTPVLILGESGTGKQLVAQEIHCRSGVSGQMVEINCASLSENLLESELFGHEKGAFTDAKEAKKGLFEIAENGTIFFDELAEMPIAIQAKLLKVLDSGLFRRVGGVTDLRSSARIMAATNKDLSLLVEKGLFRKDLYYRINVLPVFAPPLRERGDDILILAEYFMRNIGACMGKRRMNFSAQAANYLKHYHWPGNVRELKNVIERALILAEKGEIDLEHLPAGLYNSYRSDDTDFRPSTIQRTLLQVEEEHILRVLKHTNNNHLRSADILGISRSTLIARLKKINKTTV
jgi:two-component system response regulator AtoC